MRNEKVSVTKGEQVRDFLHVEDVAAAIWAISRSDLTGPVNVGSGRPITVRDVVAKTAALPDRPELIAYGALPYAEADPMFVCANNRRLTMGTGWSPKYDLHQGLAHTIEWWKLHLKTRAIE